MFLSSVNTPRPEFFVSPNGSDTTGDGSRGNPYQTLPHAVLYGAGGGIVGTDVSGSILTLLPGDYHYDFGTFNTWNSPVALSNGWLTVRSDDPVPSSATRFTSYADRAFPDKIHIQGMQVDQPPESNWVSFYGETNLWIDNCDLRGNFELTAMLGGYTKWATDCNALDVKDKPFGSVITRNCHVEGLIAEAFGSEDLLLNSSDKRHSRDQHPEGAPIHPDVWHKFSQTGVIENVIVRDLTAVDQIESQGIYFSTHPVHGFVDMAFVNVNVDNSWTFGGGPAIFNCFIILDSPCKHFLLFNSSMRGGRVEGPNDIWGGAGDVSYTDVVFKNNTILYPDFYIEGSDVLFPYPDGMGGGGAWPGIWRGPNLDPLPWTSPETNILYIN